LRENERFRSNMSLDELVSSPGEEPSEAVRTVASLLNGRSAVLIAGELRPQAKTALERAFGLKGVIWIAPREHQSFWDFEAPVARADVAVVLLAIRWTSHSHAEVQQLCDRYGKPLVRLPAGYNPNQVAVQILEQCGDRLGRERVG
jgi:hypothetical protein